jgi:hypothetical protein
MILVIYHVEGEDAWGFCNRLFPVISNQFPIKWLVGQLPIAILNENETGGRRGTAPGFGSISILLDIETVITSALEFSFYKCLLRNYLML